ncbi:MAG: hypothetical protein LUD12_10185 [Lachnospiraceae bacterium]|nr:hypothetical protein [Lachnospiraceae bacterium]
MQQELVQRIIDTIQECLSDIHTAVPAEIVSIDRSTGLATVLPTMKKVMSDGSKIAYPEISGVPIVFPQGAGQNVSITFPVNAGDKCLLIISEESLEYWLYGMETDTTLLFDITNAICIPGMFQSPPSTLYDSCDNNAIIMLAGGTKVTIKDDGVTVDGDVKINGKLTATGYVYLG